MRAYILRRACAGTRGAVVCRQVAYTLAYAAHSAPSRPYHSQGLPFRPGSAMECKGICLTLALDQVGVCVVHASALVLVCT